MDTTHRSRKTGPTRTAGNPYRPPTMKEIKAAKQALKEKEAKYGRTCISTKYGKF